MATNNLTPKQDMVVRDFYTKVLSQEDLFPEDPVSRMQAIGLCRRLLGYVVVEGKHVSRELAHTLSRKLGQKTECVDEWATDAGRAMAALYDARPSIRASRREAKYEKDTDTDTSEADSGVKAKGPSIWKALLSKDV